ncbi:MAG: YggT family protein [SAR324 cluster bacterium]|nr:YggT family protein [SAR324 cluster bacterium]
MILLIDIVQWAATIFSILVFARVIISWMGSGSTHPLVLLVYRLTEPVLAPVRSILPSFGGLDFSPVLVLIGIQVLERVLIRVLINLG